MFLLIAAGTRAGFYAVAIAFLFYCVWSKKISYLLHFSLAALVTEIFYYLYVGSHAPVFFASDVSSDWVENVPSMSHVRDLFSYLLGSAVFFSEKTVTYLSELGPVGVKIMGFLVNITQIDNGGCLGMDLDHFSAQANYVTSIGYTILASFN